MAKKIENCDTTIQKVSSIELSKLMDKDSVISKDNFSKFIRQRGVLPKAMRI